LADLPIEGEILVLESRARGSGTALDGEDGKHDNAGDLEADGPPPDIWVQKARASTELISTFTRLAVMLKMESSDVFVDWRSSNLRRDERSMVCRKFTGETAGEFYSSASGDR
jgi:hypothetical protein